MSALPRPLVFTNGVFDILHPGHIHLLERAATFGKSLVVGINSDESARRLKGSGRPVNRVEDRAAVLRALRCVDDVWIFSEDTPLMVIRELRPDVLVKDARYSLWDIVGAEEVLGWGGTVVRPAPSPGYSTTAIIAAIAKESASG